MPCLLWCQRCAARRSSTRKHAMHHGFRTDDPGAERPSPTLSDRGGDLAIGSAMPGGRPPGSRAASGAHVGVARQFPASGRQVCLAAGAGEAPTSYARSCRRGRSEVCRRRGSSAFRPPRPGWGREARPGSAARRLGAGLPLGLRALLQGSQPWAKPRYLSWRAPRRRRHEVNQEAYLDGHTAGVAASCRLCRSRATPRATPSSDGR